MKKESLLQKANSEQVTEFRIPDRELRRNLKSLLIAAVLTLPLVAILLLVKEGAPNSLGSFLSLVFGCLFFVLVAFALAFLLVRRTFKKVRYLVEGENLKIMLGEKMTGIYNLTAIKKFVLWADSSGRPFFLVLGGIKGLRIGRLEHMEEFVETIKAKIPVSPRLRKVWSPLHLAEVILYAIAVIVAFGLVFGYLPDKAQRTFIMGSVACIMLVFRPNSACWGQKYRRWDIGLTVFFIVMAVVMWLMD